MPKAKPETKGFNPRRVVAGTVITHPTGMVDVVRAVSVVLHMANGADLTYTDENEVQVLAVQPAILAEDEVTPTI